MFQNLLPMTSWMALVSNVHVPLFCDWWKLLSAVSAFFFVVCIFCQSIIAFMVDCFAEIAVQFHENNFFLFFILFYFIFGSWLLWTSILVFCCIIWMHQVFFIETNIASVGLWLRYFFSTFLLLVSSMILEEDPEHCFSFQSCLTFINFFVHRA